MPRLSRWFVPGVPQHIIQRGNNRQRIFFADDDRRTYQAWLAEIAAARGLAIHAYVLMTNHVHLLATPARPDSIPATMQTLGRRYVRHVNHARGRTGTLWEGRYRAGVVEDEAYLFRVMRYIELNPVRARMTQGPRGYRWSSHGANALGRDDALVTPHDLYLALGRTRAARAEAYRAMFREVLPDEVVESIRESVNGGWALGGEKFQAAVARKAGRRASALTPGPKPKPEAAAKRETRRRRATPARDDGRQGRLP
jgi:putative transposase